MPGTFRDTVFGAGRPLTPIPPELVKILDTTYAENRDYVVDADEYDDDVQDILRYGRLYAQRRGLSFRYMFCADGRLRFRLKDKRSYVKRNPRYWSSLT